MNIQTDKLPIVADYVVKNLDDISKWMSDNVHLSQSSFDSPLEPTTAFDHELNEAALSIFCMANKLREAIDANRNEVKSKVTPDVIDAALHAWFSGSQSENDTALEKSMRLAIDAALSKMEFI